MRAVQLIPFVMALALPARSAVLVSGTSALAGGKVRSVVVGSIQDVEQANLELSAVAILRPVSGPGQQVPCEVRSTPGEKAGDELVVWRVTLPEGVELRSLDIRRGDQIVATVTTPALSAPDLDLAEAWTGKDASLGWSLKRPGPATEASVWVRWSRDGGATWLGRGQFIARDDTDGSLDFPEAAFGDPHGLLVEFWIPQGLHITKVRHVLGAPARK